MVRHLLTSGAQVTHNWELDAYAPDWTGNTLLWAPLAARSLIRLTKDDENSRLQQRCDAKFCRQRTG